MVCAASDRLIALCAQSNRIPWWTQGAGSNLSVKAGEQIYIKASGRRLDDVRDQSAIAVLQQPPLLRGLQALCEERRSPVEADAQYRALLDAHRQASGPAPSMETGMHVLLPGREVVHLHALVAVVLAEMAGHDPDEVTRLVNGAGLTAHVVPATVPGWALAEAIAQAPRADVLLLANHGLVLQGDDAEHLLRAWEGVEAHWQQRHDAEGWGARIAHANAMQGDWLFGDALSEPTLPDVAVFLEAIVAATEPSGYGSRRRLRAGAPARAGAAAELWAAHLALSRMAPSLQPLTAAFVRKVDGLPQEQLRRARFTRDTDQRL